MKLSVVHQLSFLAFLFLSLTQTIFCSDQTFKKITYEPVPYSPSKVIVKRQDVTGVKLPEKPAIYAVLSTTAGDLVIELYDAAAPKTVQNFIDLAQGEKEFKTDKGSERRPYYDGLKFHRVIENFMAQGGCPRGDGTGGPGFQIEDEINGKALGLDKVKIKDAPQYQSQLQRAVLAEFKIQSRAEFEEKRTEVEKAYQEAMELPVLEVLHRVGYRYNEVLPSKKAVRGALAMANAGPNTNGSQFFINQVDTPHLDGLHTVFGFLVSGYDVLDRIIEKGNLQTTIRKVVVIDKRQ
ncbi:peptidylprolyl isomerase [Leptospira harrisiae]|uniref:Peptidyl-prolyl cis-trans isomerase n=1 Tax=Leptospira harrisiae TaxID=2023189 RepID=A0A2N0ANV2_9LEPT|nr:peptidylprolyl isomerase [Leptospira harrisiae]PJZ85915.1 peptidylprolyl isomerase [Leptospira harrisiae]PKA09476.1 peptidylprolyl isomerase [Leptospira harrisiae]